VNNLGDYKPLPGYNHHVHPQPHPGNNLTNILQAAFSYKSVLRSFSLLTVWLAIFWRKSIGAKVAHKMLVKLTKGNNNFVRYMHEFVITL